MSAKKKSKKPTAKKSVATKKPAGKKSVAAKKSAPKKSAARKPVAKLAAKSAKAPAKKAKKRAPAVAVKRRDGSGHLNPKYAADLHAKSGAKDTDGDSRAFLARSRSGDSLAEEMGEEFVGTVTSGEDEGVEARDASVVEEVGGPFTITSGGTEFARGTDRSNPKRSTKEPFPRS